MSGDTLIKALLAADLDMVKTTIEALAEHTGCPPIDLRIVLQITEHGDPQIRMQSGSRQWHSVAKLHPTRTEYAGKAEVATTFGDLSKRRS